jgi:hypothetical protein
MRKLSTIKYLLGVTVIFITCFAFGQNRSFSFQHFGPEDGLSNANIFAIKQDANHILYLATENGVYNFDGYNFQKIKPKTSLKSNYIRNIGFNLENQLVIINRKEGVYNFNNKTMSFHRSDFAFRFLDFIYYFLNMRNGPFFNIGFGKQIK